MLFVHIRFGILNSEKSYFVGVQWPTGADQLSIRTANFAGGGFSLDQTPLFLQLLRPPILIENMDLSPGKSRAKLYTFNDFPNSEDALHEILLPGLFPAGDYHNGFSR